MSLIAYAMAIFPENDDNGAKGLSNNRRLSAWFSDRILFKIARWSASSTSAPLISMIDLSLSLSPWAKMVSKSTGVGVRLLSCDRAVEVCRRESIQQSPD
jgi:hypothetical protein